MRQRIAYPILSAILLTGCSVLSPSVSLDDHPTWQRVPAWAQKRVQNPWWKAYGDSTLNTHITGALSDNPDLAVIAARLDRAEALLKQAGAATKPRFGLEIGWRDGRKRDVDFGPYNLAPWVGGALFSWEIDLTGKLHAATRSASYTRDAAFWDVHAARLQLASRIASTHFLIKQLKGDLALLHDSHNASAGLVRVTRSQSNAGIIAGTRLSEQLAAHQQSQRAIHEIERLHRLSVVQLRTLVGDMTSPVSSKSSSLPHPRGISNISSKQLLASHPRILAAEARVRAAFQMEKSAKLNLLPSFRLNASAVGSGNSLTGRYKIWQHQVGPSLDLPIYDPARMAQVKVNKTKRIEAAALYRSEVIKVLGEIDSARINYLNRKKQLVSAQHEVIALKRSYSHAQSRFSEGVIANDEPLRAKQKLIVAQIRERAIHEAILNDHIALMKARGGG
jgi:outer membrane protein TolC